MTTNKPLHYPTISQSFGITGIVILGMIVFSPLMLLQNVIGKEATLLVYDLLSVGMPAWFIYTNRKRKENNSAIKWSIGNKRIILPVVIGTLGLLFGIVSPLGELIPMPDSIKQAFMEVFGQKGILAFITLVVAAPILEEFIFRGIVLDGLLKNYSPAKSIFFSALLFGLVHLNPWQFLTGVLIGLFMGWVYYHTRSLLATIMIHAVANGSSFLLQLFFDADTLMNKTEVEIYGGVTNTILILSGSVILAAVSIFILQREFLKTPVNIETPQLVYSPDDLESPE